MGGNSGLRPKWNIGMMDFFFQSMIPSFQHSITPINLGDTYD